MASNPPSRMVRPFRSENQIEKPTLLPLERSRPSNQLPLRFCFGLSQTCNRTCMNETIVANSDSMSSFSEFFHVLHCSSLSDKEQTSPWLYTHRTERSSQSVIPTTPALGNSGSLHRHVAFLLFQSYLVNPNRVGTGGTPISLRA